MKRIRNLTFEQLLHLVDNYTVSQKMHHFIFAMTSSSEALFLINFGIHVL